MATLTHQIGVQWPLVAVFDFTFADAMKTTAGVLTSFKATAGIFGVVPLPYDAVVTDGTFDVIVVSNDTGTSTIKVGNSVDNDMWSDNTTIDLKTLGRTKLMKTGTVITQQSVPLLGESVLLTIANQNGDGTTGTFRMTVEYVIGGRATENARCVAAAGYLV